MKKLLVASVIALIVGFGTTNRAHAQIVYGYTLPTYGGVESVGTVYTPYGAQSFANFYSPFTGFVGQTTGNFATPLGTRSFTNFYSPFTGVVGQSYTTNIFGAANTALYGSNPLTGYRYGTGFYQPNTYVAHLGGYNYGWQKWRR
jgi:hypothetical protein